MLNKYDLRYKEFLKTNKRLSKVQSLLRELPFVKLDKPYQKGWYIFYDVRKDIKQRKDYLLIKEALELGYSNSYTDNVKVVRAIRKKDKNIIIESKNGGKNHISSYYPIRTYLTEKEYDISKNLNKFYELDTLNEVYTKYNRKQYYCSFPNYWLIIRVKPYMITHTRKRGGELEKEESYLLDKLYSFHEQYPDYGKSFPRFKDKTKLRNKIQKFKNGDTDDIYIEKIPKEYCF